ncbi:MAG: STAS domain-containing protein [Rhodanobacteraceae bacterium]|nr:STAS domain-containing protein [Rhodanobacteraceae bacterium]
MSLRKHFEPKLLTTWREGYTLDHLRRDAVAGLTVAIVALPLAMALAIASGAAPEKGLHTAIIAGFLISAFGGSRVQIGGPTGAFIPVVFAIIERHGYDGLVLATLMAGVMLLLAGWARLGLLMRYMPQPVITGFTAGIGVIIFSSQLRDLFGLQMSQVPAEFLPKMQALWQAAPSFNWAALILALACIAAIVGLRRYAPKWPGFLIAVVGGTLAAVLFNLPVETIGSRFGDLPSALPVFSLPQFDLDRMRVLLPAAFTIAFLAGIESLLSAVVADGMTGQRHRSNAELVAQGVANTASALFGGLPATGAIARTATNVRAGGRTPIAGMLHAVFVLVFMLLLAPIMRYVPLAALAAVLVLVAWGMSEIERFKHLLQAPIGDRLLLLLTFGLTVMVDLTVAIQTGLVVASFLFMHRMARTVEIEDHTLADEIEQGGEDTDMRGRLPAGVEAFRIVGPLFFGATSRIEDALRAFRDTGYPKVFILRTRLMPLIDVSGVNTLEVFMAQLRKAGTLLILSGLQIQPQKVLKRMGLHEREGELAYARDFEHALELAAAHVERGRAN